MPSGSLPVLGDAGGETLAHMGVILAERPSEPGALGAVIATNAGMKPPDFDIRVDAQGDGHVARLQPTTVVDRVHTAQAIPAGV